MKSIKPIYYVMMLAIITMLGFTSCSNDLEPQAPTREGEVDIFVTTSLPQELQTYSTTSSEGGLKNLEGQNLTVRYIMEIYTKDSKTLVKRMFAYRPLDSNQGDYRSASFETRLLASEYNFVFWADIVKTATSIPYGQALSGLDASQYYANAYFFSNVDEESDILYRPIDNNATVVGDLKTIIASRVGAAAAPISSEMYDGYSCTELVDLRTEATSRSFVLKRPFAKLRIITTDADKLQANPDWSKTTAIVTQTTELPTVFNAVTGEAESQEGTYGYWELFTVKADTYSQENVENSGTDRTLGVFYFPKPAKSQNMSFKFGIYDSANNSLAENLTLSVENVPLVANKLTTIKGNLLSTNATVTIEIKDDFIGDESTIIVNKEAATPEELYEALSGESQAITYTSRVPKSEGLTLDFSNNTRSTSVYTPGNSAILKLNIPNIEDGAVITILGNGTMPKSIVLNTGSKCSLRVKANQAYIQLAGKSYGNIVYNCRVDQYYNDFEPTVDAFLIAEGDYRTSYFFPSNEDFDMLVLDSSFNLTSECDVHAPCTLVDAIKKYISNNSGNNVFDFVGEN